MFLKDDEEYDEQFQHSISTDQQSVTRRTWDDDFVLKRQFSGTRLFKSIVSIESFFCLVLLPAFDGRPGRTNINATQDITVPTTMTPKEGRNRIPSNSITNRSCLFFSKSNSIETHISSRCSCCCKYDFIHSWTNTVNSRRRYFSQKKTPYLSLYFS